MIHRITFATGAFVEWYEPNRPWAAPTEDEPDFQARIAATARAFDPPSPHKSSGGEYRGFCSRDA